jgi:intracellular septation protein A
MQVALKHLLLDFLSAAFFFVVIALTGNVGLAIALGIGFGLLQIAVQKYLGMPVPPMQLMALGLVVVLGGASLITQDSRFIMVKPSISRFAFGVIMLRRCWLGRYLPKITRETLPASTIERTGYAWAGVMFGLAGLNLIVAATCSLQVWALYASIAPTAVKAIGVVATYLFLRASVNRRLGPAPAV